MGEHHAIAVAAWLVGSPYDILMKDVLESGVRIIGPTGRFNRTMSFGPPISSLDFSGTSYS